MLRPSHPDRNPKADFAAHPSPNGSGDVARWAEEVDGSGDVQECLVDRDPLDQRSEVPEDVDDLITELLVLREVAADEAQARA